MLSAMFSIIGLIWVGGFIFNKFSEWNSDRRRRIANDNYRRQVYAKEAHDQFSRQDRILQEISEKLDRLG